MTLDSILNPKKQYFANAKALIFDFDGTLVDSMHFWRNSQKMAQGYNSFYEYIIQNYSASVQPKQNAVELLTLLHDNGVPVCIATDTPLVLSHGFFEKYPMDKLVDFYISSADVNATKHNSPAIYHAAAERLGFKPEECIVFEDLMTSAVMAKNAGFPVVGVYDETSKDDLPVMKKLCMDYVYDLGQLMK